MEKKLKWQLVMIGAVLFMIAGFILSLWALDTGYTQLVYIGLMIIATVCVSWWFWVMIVIKTIMTTSDKTTDGMEHIKNELGIIRTIVKSMITRSRDK